MRFKLTAYAMDFASFLIQKISKKEKIKNIILFGSVARGESDESSDIDLFIDVTEEKMKREIESISESFILSSKYKNYWKLLGVKNEIKLTIGVLDDWTELKPSILANGTTLYGKFKTNIEGDHKAFFIWENVKPNSKRVVFNKKLLGYSQSGKFYSGILQEYDGEKLGKGCILVPLEHSSEFHKLFKKHNISVKIKKIVDYK